MSNPLGIGPDAKDHKIPGSQNEMRVEELKDKELKEERLQWPIDFCVF